MFVSSMSAKNLCNSQQAGFWYSIAVVVWGGGWPISSII